jgi:tetratricopeptide (TPR) repeat protein
LFSPPAQASSSSSSLKEEIRTLARKGLLDSAYKLSRKALEADSNDVFALFMAAKLSSDGRASGEYFKKVIKVGGKGVEAKESYFRLGQYFYAAGKYYQAVPFFRDYLLLFPSGDWKDPARYWMGNACMSYAQSKTDKAAYLDSALAYFEQLSKDQKGDAYYLPLALEGEAKAKAMKGDRDGAWEAAKSAMDKAPDEERSTLLLLSAQLRQGVDREDEKRFIEKLVSQYPQSPEARYLRKLNSGTDPSRWKAGSGLPKAIVSAIKDSTVANAGAPGHGADSSGKATVTAPVTSGGDGKQQGNDKGFTLQLGAFSQAPNAQAMVANVTKLGFAPELVESARNGKRIYQVRLGRFPSAEAATAYALKNLKPHQLLSQPVPLAP